MSLQFVWDAPKTRIERDFDEYIQTPHGRHLERLLIDMARRLLLAGRTRYGIAALFEAARFEYALLGKHEDGFKANNSYRSYMARKIMRENADLEGTYRGEIIFKFAKLADAIAALSALPDAHKKGTR